MCVLLKKKKQERKERCSDVFCFAIFPIHTNPGFVVHAGAQLHALSSVPSCHTCASVMHRPRRMRRMTRHPRPARQSVAVVVCDACTAAPTLSVQDCHSTRGATSGGRYTARAGDSRALSADIPRNESSSATTGSSRCDFGGNFVRL